ncbi:hypothetical protein DPEC_G00194130 [Dallia pectoralis]|uniref:Uncharacterized protein n=1 Tax=Dallia pectoralis TaxID=75939 RepID=A0ACC2G7G2_DALPE|nr:hypothetical protein DPEC_G00194130 [Dallia pectoralis]
MQHTGTRRAENRINLIPTTLIQDLGYCKDSSETILMLDVGCNSGDLTVALYRHLQQRAPSEDPIKPPHTDLHLMGIDLDEALIHRAQQTNPFPQMISFIPLDITEDSSLQTQLEVYLSQHARSHFHLTLCLAVTMWVHLNHGDSALLRLLSRLASISHHLLLEAQPWKCYRSAARRLRKLGRSDFDHFKALAIRGDVAEHAREHLEKHCGMVLIRCFGSTTWDRRLLLFRRTEITEKTR